MMGLEKMLGQMIGMTPDEMQTMAKQMHEGLLAVAGTVKRIEDKCDAIASELEGLKNERCERASDCGSDGPGNGGGNGVDKRGRSSVGNGSGKPAAK